MTIRSAAVVLHFRTPQLTITCLDSLVISGVSEVALVDNSQDDGSSLAKIWHVIERMIDSGVMVHVLSPSANLGFSRGVNFAIKHLLMDGPVRVLLVNSDVVLTGFVLRALERAISEGCDIAAPLLRTPDHTNEIRRVRVGYNRWFSLQLPCNVFGTIGYLSGACLILSERVVCSGLFDEDFFFYGEDVELSKRLQDLGARSMLLDSITVEHANSGSSRKGSMFYEYHTVRGHWLLARKLTDSNFGVAFAVLMRMIILPLRGVWRAVRQGSLIPVCALGLATWDGLSGRSRDLTPPV